MSDSIASRVLEAFCLEFAVQPRDLGIGRFHVQQSPLGTGPLQGICIFDATHGSLRLTERLGEHFKHIVCLACSAAGNESLGGLYNPLSTFCSLTESLGAIAVPTADSPSTPIELSEWIEVVAANEKALLVSGTQANEVTILGHFFTLQGLKYHLKHEDPNVRWTVEASVIQPMPGMTKTELYNPNTAEQKPKPPGS